MMKIVFAVFIFCVTLYADKNLDSALQQLSQFANHQIPSVRYNPFEEKRAAVEMQNTAAAHEIQTNRELPQLKSIFNNRAFINNRWYGVGESIGSFTLLAIESDGVMLQKDKNQFFFELQTKQRNFFNLSKTTQ